MSKSKLNRDIARRAANHCASQREGVLLKSEHDYPEGIRENSPTLQRWDQRPRESSPEGTAEPGRKEAVTSFGFRISDFGFERVSLLTSAPTKRTKSLWRVNSVSLLLLLVFCLPLAAQDSSNLPERLPRADLKNGDATLRAFLPVAKATRNSIVKLDLNGATVALAVVIDSSGLAITKASEVKDGKLTCWLPNGKEVGAELLRTDADNDLGLIRVRARGLKPIQWANETATVGQWVVTPGTSELPQAVGIISARRRKILPKRALIGVQLDFEAKEARINQIVEGLGADKAGLKPGDTILAVNDAAVKAGDELVRVLRQFREGQLVKLRVQRETNEFDASVKMMIPSSTGAGRVDREDRMNRMGSEPSDRAEGFEQVLQHDTVLQNWQCGGPLVNLDGKAVGINIARAGRVASYALPADLAQKAIDKLVRAARTK